MSLGSPRPSPFKRPESPVRAPSPSMSPVKTFASSSRPSSPMLSPERQSPFVRRPSQLAAAHDRPRSPFARPASSLSVADNPTPPLEPSTRPTDLDADPFITQSPSPTIVHASSHMDGTRSSPISTFSHSPPLPPLTARPPTQRTVTSSTATTVRASQPPSQPQASRPPLQKVSFVPGVGGYNHIPQALLRNMRESFEVLDTQNSGSITAASVREMLDQLGMDSSSSSVSAFFPPGGPQSLNLARFLDTLSGPMADLSHGDELAAAFEAFDVDDSGQIDVGEMRDALLCTVPENGQRMSEREIDAILGEFAGRRAFGAKGLGREMGGLGGKGRGDVFRYRDFMAGITGAGAAGDGQAVQA